MKGRIVFWIVPKATLRLKAVLFTLTDVWAQASLNLVKPVPAARGSALNVYTTF